MGYYRTQLGDYLVAQTIRTWPEAIAAAVIVVVAFGIGSIVSPLTGRSWWEGGLSVGTMVLIIVLIRALAGWAVTRSRRRDRERQAG